MTIRLHDNLSSGNGYEVRLLLAQLGVPYERIEYDIDRGETRTPQFLEGINANGRVPVLETTNPQSATYSPTTSARGRQPSWKSTTPGAGRSGTDLTSGSPPDKAGRRSSGCVAMITTRRSCAI